MDYTAKPRSICLYGMSPLQSGYGSDDNNGRDDEHNSYATGSGAGDDDDAEGDDDDNASSEDEDEKAITVLCGQRMVSHLSMIALLRAVCRYRSSTQP